MKKYWYIFISGLLIISILILFNPFPHQVQAAVTVDTITAGVDNTGLTNGSTFTSNSFSTNGSNELVLAIIQAATTNHLNAIAVSNLTGAGLTWVEVANETTVSASHGEVSVWRAFASSPISSQTLTGTVTGVSDTMTAAITVIAFSGVDTSGSNGSGAIGATNVCQNAAGTPTCSLTTTRNNSWVLGSLLNWTNGTAPTVPGGQTAFGGISTVAGDYYWGQQQNAVTPTSGTSVTINDSAPTVDYAEAIVEVLPPVTTLTHVAVRGGGTPGSTKPYVIVRGGGSNTGPATAVNHVKSDQGYCINGSTNAGNMGPGCAGVATKTFTYTPNTAGNAVLFGLDCSGSAITGVTLTASGWTTTQLSPVTGNVSAGFVASFWAYAPNTTQATFTVTWTGGSNCNFFNDLVDEFSGADATTAVDAHNQAVSSGSATVTCTPANNNDGLWGAANDSLTAVGAGFTQGADDTQQDWSEWKILSGGSGSPQTVNFTGSGNYNIVCATVKPGTSSGGAAGVKFR